MPTFCRDFAKAAKANREAIPYLLAANERLISCAVWLYFRFSLSLRMVEEMLAARGICASMNRALWRAVDQNGLVLDVLAQRRRDAYAAQLLKSAVTPPR
jgi:transposase-like protein